MRKQRLDFAGHGVYFAYPVNLVTEKFNPNGIFLRIGGKYLHRVAPHPEFIADKINIVPLILQIHQLAQKLIAAFLHSRAEGYHHVFIIYRVSQ